MAFEFGLKVKEEKTMKKLFSIELPRNDRSEAFTSWLKSHKVDFAVSSIEGGFVHYSIWLNPSQVDVVNSALDEIVWKEAE